MATKQVKIVRPDSKGRITLGSFARGYSSFIVTQDKAHRIILEPQVEIPANERWLFKNKVALRQVAQGIEESAKGHVKSRGSFAKYKEEDIEE